MRFSFHSVDGTMLSTLVRQVDAALERQPELLGPLVHLVDAEHVADGVEVGVARLLDRVAQVDVAMAAVQVALEEPAVESAAARADRSVRSGVITPSSSAAVATTILNVDPGDSVPGSRDSAAAAACRY